MQSSGQPGADDATLYVRGVGSLSTDLSQPLMLVDGVERSFFQLDPNEVESITVLKDASATAVFGVRRCKWCHSGYNQTWYIREKQK